MTRSFRRILAYLWADEHRPDDGKDVAADTFLGALKYNEVGDAEQGNENE